MRRPPIPILLILALLLNGCAGTPRASAPDKPRAPLVVLISIDGFRADYLDRGITPALSALAAAGARGEMRTSFPSKTFPNHYTLVTGLRPDRHGIIDNNMEDPDIPGVRFSQSNKEAVCDARWWNGGTPIWVSAERAGIRTGTIFWPGSEAAIQGVRPSSWAAFDQAMPADARVDQALAWLDLPPDQRPRLVTLYFDEVDTFGHHEGPDGPGLNAAVRRTDAAIGRLVAGLKSRGLAANLVVVADHGMAAVAAERMIVLEDLLPPDAGRAMALGAFMTYAPAPGKEAQVEAALLRPHARMACWRKSHVPRRYHYGQNRRAPPIFCLPQTGWEITTRAWVSRRKPVGGNHGFDPYDWEMRAVFVAAGPDIAQGVRLPVFDNVDVYPLLTRLVGVKAEPSDGVLRSVARALKSGQERPPAP